MSYHYHDQNETVAVIIIFILAMALVAITIAIATSDEDDPVLSEQLSGYELDPTIVEVQRVSCDVSDSELKRCTVTFEAPLDLVAGSEYIRLINPSTEAEVAEEEPLAED